MHVVLDAEVITSAGFGNSPLFRFIVSTAPVVDIRLCVPSLVIDEVVANFGREINKEVRTLNGALKKLSRHLRKELPSPTAELQQRNEVSLYRNRLLKALGPTCVVLPYPDSSHQELVARAIARRRPFDEKGSGFRDALIWDSVLELATQGDGVLVLVSGDGDFSDKADCLHPDLVKEVQNRGLVKGTVTLARSLPAFVDLHIRPRLRSLLEDDPHRILEHLGLGPEGAVSDALEGIPDRDWSPLELGLQRTSKSLASIPCRTSSTRRSLTFARFATGSPC